MYTITQRILIISIFGEFMEDEIHLEDDLLKVTFSPFGFRCAELLPLIYPPELEVKETTDTASSASILTYTSNLTTVVNSVLKLMINETTSILKS